MKMSNKMYDIIKWVATYFLPGCGVLYIGLSKIWGLPYPEEVLGTITILDAVLGAMIGISSITYKGDGTIEIDTKTDEEKDIYRLVLNIPVEDLIHKASVLFKVDSKTEMVIDE